MNLKILSVLATAVAGCVFPSVAGNPEVEEVLAGVKSRYAPDVRVAVWTVKASDDSVCVLTGNVGSREAKFEILSAMKRKGILFDDRIAVLPDSTVSRPWALVRVSVACIRGEARSGGELTSQAIMGTPVKVWSHAGDMPLVQTPDGYLGYVTDNSLQMLTDAEMERWRQSPRRIVVAYQSTLYARPDGDESNVVSDLLLGNILEYIGEEGDYAKLSLPDGRVGYAHKGGLADVRDWADQSFDFGLIERNARRMLGVPYLWGGMSTKMADCSGFVKTVYFSNGIILQRDASQQALTGKKVDWRKWREEAKPGDLIFIGTKAGKVTHVAMYIGDGKYIHSSGLVRINSMDPDSPDYLDYVFLSMSRIDGEVGTPGIVAVENHPWYFQMKNNNK